MTSLSDRGRCPICRRAAMPETRPFCSRRCADIDLQRWFAGAYAIPGEDEDQLEGGQAGQEPATPL